LVPISIRRRPKAQRLGAGERHDIAARAPAGDAGERGEHVLVGLLAFRRAGLIAQRADRDRDRIARNRRLGAAALAPQIDLRLSVRADRDTGSRFDPRMARASSTRSRS